ncbi:MAG TPA: Wzz/FepE/Etk N-terminal domain-containing protein, partial [Lysobacter sp.]|nr:Wzz/FepE/Etk N-terminal domain-containing protein [Lysobacter sp.]
MATYLSTRTSPPPQIVPPSVRDEEIDLRTLLGTLGDSKRLILFGTLMFLLASVLYVVLATPKYEASATVQVEKRTPTFPGLSANSSAMTNTGESAA